MRHDDERAEDEDELGLLVDSRNATELDEASQDSQRSTLFTVCPFILGNEFCERLAYYGLATNLITYMRTEMLEEPAFAAIMVQLFEGTCYLTPLLGAWLADLRWGRYKTILVFSSIYVLGMVLLAGSTTVYQVLPDAGEKKKQKLQDTIFYLSLYIVALGTGGIKPNVSAFGADQFDEANAKDREEKESFFNWFYFAINLGSLLAVTVIVYVQDNISWAIGFGIPAAAMVLAIVLFVAGAKNYTHVPPTESPVERVVKVVKAAIRNSWRRKRPRSVQHTSNYDGPVNLPEGIAAAMRKTHSYMWLDNAVKEPNVDAGLVVEGYTPEQVEEVRMVVRLLPVFFTTILYWTVYAQMGTFFIMQGTQMERSMFGGKFFIPAASLSLFNIAAIIGLIPVYDRVFVPLLARFGKKLTLLQRIGWGLVVCALSMLVSAWVEHRRLVLFHQGAWHKSSEPDLHHIRVVDMSVFWQIPQYLLVGLSEILASIGQLEFFYDQAPMVMRSCSMALQLLSVCIGSYLSGALVYAVGRWSVGIAGAKHGWLPNDLNHGRVDLFFLLLAGLMLVNLVLFLWVASKYEYKALEKPRVHPPKPPRGVPPRWVRPRIVTGVVPPRTGRSAGIDIVRGASIHPEEDVGIYGRSLAFQGQQPALPLR